jgi:hypothetical protein
LCVHRDITAAFSHLAILLSRAPSHITLTSEDREKFVRDFKVITQYAEITFAGTDDENSEDEKDSIATTVVDKKKSKQSKEDEVKDEVEETTDPPAPSSPDPPTPSAAPSSTPSSTDPPTPSLSSLSLSEPNEIFVPHTPSKAKKDEPSLSSPSDSAVGSGSKKLKKTEDEWTLDIQKEIHRCASQAEKNEDGSEKTPEQQMAWLRSTVQSMLAQEVGTRSSDGMTQKDCEAEIDGILVMQSKMKELGLLFRYRCGMLWNRFVYLAEKEMEDGGWMAEHNGIKYDTPTGYLSAKYSSNRTDVVQHQKFYKLVLQFIPLLKCTKGWRWIRDAMTHKKLQTQIDTWNRHQSFDIEE